ncbi:HDIG domain-containing protein [Clostridium tertium]|jgi:putative nucleotidyltransferase with HDIG domain|uniref:HDIG domain-containing protein n=1 Tax=Clostridium tertium TaxID=1559 RepID=A0A9X4B3N9_9CLOT|nr:MULTISPECIES: HDIG domain-containing metalloprotein [Clostridium]MBS5305805.1 HDIG domain-containing protein [Clostridium sp.]MBU6136200.1 HDIG domain-containing protein [Clostridium tertium]MDB1922919.1 HDIG domain-containing protein [Clostridium tertium]MDB1925586.1 HDIG domain-containing protein [Clostridium tertium]MDB1929781.1 HDIG domain-containing protein [Clostridium tertium]
MDLFWNKEKKKDDIKYKRGFTYLTVFLVIYLLLLTVIAPKRHNLSVGDIATVDIKAPIDTVDEIATKQKEEEAMAKAREDKQYIVKSEVKAQAIENVNKLFNKIVSENSSNKEEKDKIAEIKKIEEFNLTDAEYKILVELKEKTSEIQHLVVNVLETVYKEEIEENKYEDLLEAKSIADSQLSNSNIDRDLEDVLKNICHIQINPNKFVDNAKMEEAVKEAQKSVPKEIIKKNQIIVKEGEPVTERQIEILKELGLLNNGTTKSYLFSFISLGILVALVLFIQYRYISKEKPEVFNDTKMIILISSINLIIILISMGLNVISPYLIPLVCSAMLMTILIDYKISLVVNLLNIIFIAIIVGFNPSVVVLSILSVVLGSTGLKKVQQRNDIIYSTIYITGILALLSFTLGMISSNNIKEILIQTGYTAIGILLSGILAVGLLPFFESIFDVVTNIKLLELSNPNQPLMKKLLMEAPGTYHHSMMVANLAEAAAEAVGGNPVVARVGAYYHDIGKTKRPYFFGENQMGKENPHDKITPNLSTLIILSHTKDGLEMAREHKIPKVIQDMIEQHHGTTLVKYFYYKLKNSSDKPEEIKEEDFRYPGPIPSFKESGILMLSDSVEAAVRSINEPTKGKIEEMVNNIINDKLNSRQLVNCDLTLKDIETIRKTFLKTLDGIYHHRIEYPTEKKVK